MLDRLIRTRQPDVVDAAGWRAIDAAERSRGVADGRPRTKLTTVPDLLTEARASRSAHRGRGHIDRIASWISS